jgi:hypothetical protein
MCRRRLNRHYATYCETMQNRQKQEAD